ncbi:hypothetical protein FRC18_011498 [Serendipita sp. 400]|nr:hypothetical protein FRC18_011498 [Serendipita sp. 400]
MSKSSSPPSAPWVDSMKSERHKKTPSAREQGEEQGRRYHSASSELTSLSSDEKGSHSSSSSGATVKGGRSKTRSHHDEESTSHSSNEESNENSRPKGSKAPSREERGYYRDLLNKRLEQMFVKAKIPLTPYGRIPWTRLGESLACSSRYISGFPEDFAPKAVNDQLPGGSAPSTWSINRSKPLVDLIDQGKISIFPRPSGRRVLFELVRPDGSMYDSTIGYSSRWLHENMSKEFPVVKRPRSSMGDESSNSSRSSSPEYGEPETFSDISFLSDSDDIRQLNSYRKRQKLSEGQYTSGYNDWHAEYMIRRNSPRRPPDKSRGTIQNLKQGEKWKEGGVIKRVGKGWIVIEESTEEESPQEQEKSQPKRSLKNEELTKSIEEPKPAAQKKRKRSEPPESNSRPVKRPHGESKQRRSPTPILSDEKRLQWVTARISKLIKDGGYDGTKKIPWNTLPLFLTQKKLYITGFPNTCIPKVIDDEVKNVSSPPHWKPAQAVAMEEAFNKSLVKILPRPTGRRVLFSTSGVDGKFYDSTCGYSDTWLDAHMEDTIVSKESDHLPDEELSLTPTQASRPSLKIVIPETGKHFNQSMKPKQVSKTEGNKRSAAKSEPAKSEPPPVQPKSPSTVTSIPRVDLPTPVIFLQPPTPLDRHSPPQTPRPLDLPDDIQPEAPPTPKLLQDTASQNNLGPPPVPDPVEPIALPQLHEDEIMVTGQDKPQRRPSFTFVIPPIRSEKQRKKTPDTSAEIVSLDGTGSGYDLSLLFDVEHETASPGLPPHLQAKIDSSPPKIPSFSTPPAVQQKSASQPRGLLTSDQELIGKLNPSLSTSLDSVGNIEVMIKPALIKLFDSAGLSSPSVLLPWVTLPLLLCHRRLFISGFPRECLPRVVRDRVDAQSGPTGWSYSSCLAMFTALKAGEVKIKGRPLERIVLFHLLPSDTDRMQGNHRGVDSTLEFSQAWIKKHIIDESEDPLDESMQFEPTGQATAGQRPMLTPLRPVFERFGQIKIEDESDSEDEKPVVPDPPWKVAIEELTRPMSTSIVPRSSFDKLSKNVVESDSSSDDSEEDESNPPDLSIDRLLPSHLPYQLQGRGRIVLGVDDRFEWIPRDPYATDCPPSRIIWNSVKSKWTVRPEIRDFARYDRTSFPVEIPVRVGGKILGKGVCEHNPMRRVWECSFVGRDAFGDLRWSPDIAAWEWFLRDADGRRKWLQRADPNESYDPVDS